MAQGNYREYLKNDPVWIKKYFYVLRPLLAIKWIEQKNSVMPMEFGTLVEALIDDDRLKAAIEGLLERKKQGLELDKGERIPLISEFIESELSRLETQLGKLKAPKPPTEKLNEVFRLALEAVW